MKKQFLIIISALILPLAVFAYSSPGSPTGFVNDFAGVLSVQEVQDIDAKLSTLKHGTGFEVAVVMVSTIGNDETIESYAVKLFQEWGIGDKDKDTGILMLIAVADRRVRIETGYGAEGAVTDIQSANIVRNVLTPAFREGKYGAGISGAVDALNAIITKSPEAEQYSVINNSVITDPTIATKINVDVLGGAFFLVIVAINLLGRILGKTKSWWLGGVLGAIIGAIIGFFTGLAFGIFATIFLTILGLFFDFVVSKRPPGSSGHGGIWPIFFGGGRGGGFGGGGGGFGGFGGGMSGGGGASGRW
jgi:uncharacterized protein